MAVSVYLPHQVSQQFSAQDQALDKLLEKSFSLLLKHVRKSRASLEIQLVGDRRIRTLNREFRHKDSVTDVLSFPMDAQRPALGLPWILGEIVICYPEARRQAQQSKRDFSFQIVRLALHGLVHLLGYDHELSDADRKVFERLETKYLHYLSQQGMIQWDGCLQL